MCIVNSIIVDDHSNEINNHKVIRVFVAKKGNYTANPDASGTKWVYKTKSLNHSIFQSFNLLNRQLCYSIFFNTPPAPLEWGGCEVY